jgi:hypothetical protein
MLLAAMPKKKVKRSSAAKASSSKRSAGSSSQTKPKPRAAKRAKPARSAKASGSGAIDPRVLAAIGLALEDEAQASARAAQLSQPASPWVALGRVRAVRTN